MKLKITWKAVAASFLYGLEKGAYRLKVMIGAERVPRRRLKGSHGGDWWWELGIGPNSLT